ncbi:MAG: 50S ribosomal protein L4 [Candidatus Moranbacteria bacterium]|nr:50S ribosomal protein L4 [bacterium]MDP1834142.1 50S ribosomal protein L4 [Candidatus Moranbacteria bacterium]
MAKVKLYNIEGKEVKEIEISDAVFGLPANDDLVHQVFVSLGANQRQVLAHTKTRGERSGSGIKPWKQKGTGRARVGSSRTPTWRGGGVAFGPTNERNFKKKINKKMNTKAIATVLSAKLRDGEMVVLDKLSLNENKTKEMARILKNLEIKGRMLIGFSVEERGLRAYSRNIEKVNNILVEKLNVLDMLNNKNLVLSQDSIKYLEDKYQSKA